MYLDSSGYVHWVWGQIWRMDFNEKMYSPRRRREYVSPIYLIFHIRP
jgi:hypothetical protein